MQNLVRKYPEVFTSCEAVLAKLNQNGFPAKEEISFDLLLPFLLPLPDKNIQLKMSYELSIYRELIDNYNKGNVSGNLQELFFNSAGYHPISLKDYIYFNRKREIVDSDIIKSYEFSTDRVFYRFSIMLNYKQYFNSDETFNLLMNDILKISAFLLFDDDMCDLSDDIKNDKDTILSSYLQIENSDIKLITNKMLAYIKTIKNDMLSEFITIITPIYE